MVFLQLLAFIHLVLPSVCAKGITDLPPCSLGCVTREAVDLRCELTDTICLCSKPAFITGAITCSQPRCKRPDLSTTNEVLTEMCAAVSVSPSSSLPPSTTSSSTTSKSGSTATAASSSASSIITPPPRASTSEGPGTEPSTSVVIATVFDPPSSFGTRTRSNLWGGIVPAVVIVLGLCLKP